MQAPDVAKAKMYKVLKQVLEENKQGSQGSSSVPCYQLAFMLPRTVLLSSQTCTDVSALALR